MPWQWRCGRGRRWAALAAVWVVLALALPAPAQGASAGAGAATGAGSSATTGTPAGSGTGAPGGGGSGAGAHGGTGAAEPVGAPAPPDVRVALDQGVTAALVAGEAGVTVRDSAGKVLAIFGPGQVAQAVPARTPLGPAIALGPAGQPPVVLDPGPLRFEPGVAQAAPPGENPPGAPPSSSGASGGTAPSTGSGPSGAIAPPSGTAPGAPLAGAAPVPGQAAGEGILLYGGRRYRGTLEVRLAGPDRLDVINVVDVESYLRGVVPAEMPATWPLEALKAQAVASRTYVLRQREAARRAGSPVDVTDDTGSQVYRGADAERPSTDQAVAATRGQVLTYAGQLISALFHSAAGGHTEDNEVIFPGGTPAPYLRGVPDFDQASPHYRWEVRQPPAAVARALKEVLGVDVGPTVTAVAPAGRRGSGARWSHWQFTGPAGTVQVSGQDLRRALGLRSAPRAVEWEGGGAGRIRVYQGEDPVQVVAAGGRQGRVPLAAAAALGAGRGAAPQRLGYVAVARGAPQGPAGAAPDTLVFAGGGWGHGVGLSQWGARGLALLGRSYVEILSYYYSGAKVESYAGK